MISGDCLRRASGDGPLPGHTVLLRSSLEEKLIPVPTSADALTVGTDPAVEARALVDRLAGDLDSGVAQANLANEIQQLVDLVRKIDLDDADNVTTRFLLDGALEVETSTRTRTVYTQSSLRLGLETIRQALDRLSEDRLVADSRPLSELINWMVRETHATPSHLARIVGVDPKTLRRWASEPRETTAETDEMRRARDLARVVLQLSHVLTGRGVISWLETNNPDLKDNRPADLLGDPVRVEQIIGLAAQGRSQAAS